ncbi:MAG: ABC transporter permease, partial [Acidobacteria bacterium]|nr:ABC transporter permease [Acidobacteriota bacterium]
MKDISQDVRFAFRLLGNNLGFTAVAVLTLALGIAANTTVFGWIDNLLLNPFPGAARPKELALLESVKRDGEPLINNSFLDYQAYRDNLQLFSGLAASRFTRTYLGNQRGSQMVFVELVSRNFFEVLGVKPALGRNFRSDECVDQAATCPLAVISNQLWRSRFRGDPSIVGKTIRLTRYSFTVVGVAPETFSGAFAGLAFDVWVPLNWAEELGTGNGTLNFRGTRDLTTTVGRLRPGVTIEQAQAEVSSIAARLEASDPRNNRGISNRVVRAVDGHNGAQQLLQGPLRMLMAVCFVLLLIVCANVANLLLARMVSRQREFTIRMALGSQTARLVRQVFTETLLLAAAGALVGILMSQWMGQVLVALLPPNDVPLALERAASARTLGFTILVTGIATLLAGVAPAWFAARANLSESLKQGGRSEAGAGSHKLRAVLVVAEVALASVAIIGAGLFVRSFHNATAIHPGFATENIVTGNYYLSPAGYTGPQQREFCRRLRQRLEATPGIAAVSYTDYVPLQFGSSPWHQLVVEGYEPSPGEDMNLHRTLVPPGYFDLMEIPLLEGREFTLADDAQAAKVVIVNQTFTRRFFPAQPVLGRRLKIGNGWWTIVGVVRDSKYHQQLEAPTPYYYMPFDQWFAPGLNFSMLVKTKGDAALATRALRRESLALNPDAQVYNVLPLDQAISSALYPQRVAASLLSVVGSVALLLAIVGLYSVMSFAVGRRSREIGL